MHKKQITNIFTILIFAIIVLLLDLRVVYAGSLPDFSGISLPQKTVDSSTHKGMKNNSTASLELLHLRVKSSLDGNRDKMNVVAVFNEKPQYQLLLLDKPPRFIVNLPQTRFSFSDKQIQNNSILQNFRYGGNGKHKARLIFSMRQPFRLKATHMEPLSSSGNQTAWQVVWEFSALSQQEFEAYLQMQHDNSINFSTRSGYQEQLDDRSTGELRASDIQATDKFKVAIDAGHGGFDSGTIGVNGRKEKNLVLSFAQTLASILRQRGSVEPFLTRNSDKFLRLRERVERAREEGADLFVSIHADHIDTNSLRGATVYTLSNKASDDMAKLLAEKENRADLLDGLPPDEPSIISDILVDMTRRETRLFSEKFSKMVVQSFTKGSVILTTNPERSAGFQVLRAADIPSVLIELGYLSNVQDEEKIANPKWREKVANILATTIEDYAKLHAN